MKKFAFWTLLTFCLIGTAYAGVEQEIVIFFRGDVDGSGAINISDPIALNSYLFAGGPEPGTCEDVWDANGDGYANAADPVYLLNYLFNGGPSPDPLMSKCLVE